VAVLSRAVATGMIGVLLGIYLAERRLTAADIGIVVGAGLAGATLATALVTFGAHKLGNRSSLIGITVLTIIGAVCLALSTRIWILGFAAFIGMVNGMGRDRGAALVLEQAALPATTSDANRTMAFAKYNVLQDIGHAAGSLIAAVPALVAESIHVSEASATRGSIWTYALLCALPLIAYMNLSPAIDAHRSVERPKISPDSRRTLARISGLFAIDSVAGGFLTTALLAYFFYERFGVDAGEIGILFFIARVANAGSHFAAAWLARRIGLVNTMVFTHLPSNVLLMLVPLMPTVELAVLVLLARFSISQMDVPARQSYTMAVVDPDERSAAAGITGIARTTGAALSPLIAAPLFAVPGLASVPFFLAGALKIVYDLALWRAFRERRPPEESER
jgi:MFS family permease